MPKYLSARRLKITTAEHRALVRVSELIGATPNYDPDKHPDLKNPDDLRVAETGLLFDMGYAARPTVCGTVACVGGHVSLVMQGVDLAEEHPVVTAENRSTMGHYVNSRYSAALHDLYWPDNDIYDSAIAVDAIHAVVNFLKTGFPSWGAVIRARRTREVEIADMDAED